MKVERIGSYEIVGELGEGGMGIVYKARQAGLNRICALKVLLPNLTRKEQFVERFLREARSAARLDHPNIVTIYDVGHEKGIYYFSMQYVKGEDLSSMLKMGPLRLEEAVDVISQVADGLSHAHDAGIIHRDIKPANIIIDENGVAVITDFGIARAAWEEKLTTTGQSIGTIEYMSPEQFKGGNLESRCDIYSLGATFYRMVTGKSPFPGETTQEVMYKKFQGSFPRPTETNDSLPPWVDEIVAGAMAEDPGDRFGSATEFKNALELAALGKPVMVGGTKKIDVEKIFRGEETRVVKGVGEPIDRGAKTAVAIGGVAGKASRQFRRKRNRVLIALSLVFILAVVGALLVPRLLRNGEDISDTPKTPPPPTELTLPKGEAPAVAPPPKPDGPLTVAPVIDHDEEIKNTIGTVFEAWETLDVNKYMSVWSYDAYQYLKNGVVRDYEELKEDREEMFLKYSMVVVSWEILNIYRTEETATVYCQYRMTFYRADGGSFTEDDRERYVLELFPDGKWYIVSNYDYL